MCTTWSSSQNLLHFLDAGIKKMLFLEKIFLQANPRLCLSELVRNSYISSLAVRKKLNMQSVIWSFHFQKKVIILRVFKKKAI